MRNFIIFFFLTAALACSSPKDDSASIKETTTPSAVVVDTELDTLNTVQDTLNPVLEDSSRAAYEEDLSLEIKEIEEEKEDPISESCKLFLEDYAATIASFDQLLNSIDDNPDNINLIIARSSQEEELNGYSSDPQMFQCLQNPAFKKQVDILNNKRERLISN